MTHRVLVCGADDYANAEMIRYALSRLVYQKGTIELFDVGGLGANAGARWYRTARGWPGETVWCVTAVLEVRPDYVLCFGRDDQGVTDKARAAGIKVGEVL